METCWCHCVSEELEACNHIKHEVNEAVIMISMTNPAVSLEVIRYAEKFNEVRLTG